MRRAMSTLVYRAPRAAASRPARPVGLRRRRGHRDLRRPRPLQLRRPPARARNCQLVSQTSGIAFHSMHSPMHGDDEWGRSGARRSISPAVEKRDRIAAMDEIKRAIEVAEQAPFQFLVQHVGVGGEEADEHKLDAAMNSLEHLHAFAKPLGVQLLVENIPNELVHAGEADGIAARRALRRYRRVLRCRPCAHHVERDSRRSRR